MSVIPSQRPHRRGNPQLQTPRRRMRSLSPAGETDCRNQAENRIQNDRGVACLWRAFSGTSFCFLWGILYGTFRRRRTRRTGSHHPARRGAFGAGRSGHLCRQPRKPGPAHTLQGVLPHSEQRRHDARAGDRRHGGSRSAGPHDRPPPHRGPQPLRGDPGADGGAG